MTVLHLYFSIFKYNNFFSDENIKYYLNKNLKDENILNIITESETFIFSDILNQYPADGNKYLFEQIQKYQFDDTEFLTHPNVLKKIFDDINNFSLEIKEQLTFNFIKINEAIKKILTYIETTNNSNLTKNEFYNYLLYILQTKKTINTSSQTVKDIVPDDNNSDVLNLPTNKKDFFKVNQNDFNVTNDTGLQNDTGFFDKNCHTDKILHENITMALTETNQISHNLFQETTLYNDLTNSEQKTETHTAFVNESQLTSETTDFDEMSYLERFPDDDPDFFSELPDELKNVDIFEFNKKVIQQFYSHM